MYPLKPRSRQCRAHTHSHHIPWVPSILPHAPRVRLTKWEFTEVEKPNVPIGESWAVDKGALARTEGLNDDVGVFEDSGPGRDVADVGEGAVGGEAVY